jgi:flagellar protein FlaJ
MLKNKRLLIKSALLGMGLIGLTFAISSLTGIGMIRDLGIAAGVLLTILPISMEDLKIHKKRTSIDLNIPFFLLEVTGAVHSGMSLLKAIEGAADRDLGFLTHELKNIRGKISWGIPIDETFESAVKSMGTLLSRRVFLLLLIAVKSGGKIHAMLEMVQKHVTELQNLEKDRKASMRPYVFTIYIAFIVFLATTTILVNSFFTEIANLQVDLQKKSDELDVDLGRFATVLGIDISGIKNVLFHMSIVEALFAGVVAGKIGEGSFGAGIKHVVILIIITMVVFLGVVNVAL